MSDQDVERDVERDAIVIPEFESRLEAAKSRGADDDEMQTITDEYQQARQNRYDKNNQTDNNSSDNDSPVDPNPPQTTDPTSEETDRPLDPNPDTQNDPNAAPAQTGQ